MTAEQKINDVSLSLNSAKKKERLEAFDNLFQLLHEDDIVCLLHKCTLKKNLKINWDVLFVRMHNAAISLIDENSSKIRQLPDKNVKVLQSIMSLVVQKSVYQKIVLINCNLIISCISGVFETDFRSKYLGCTYLSIFQKYVILEKKNWNQLKKNSWLSMKNIFKNNVKNPPPGTHSIMFLEMLCEVIKSSSKNCQISQDFLDLFDFVEDIFINYKGMGANNEIILLRLTNILCLQLAVEFRYKVCKFTEAVFDYVISFQRKNNSDLNLLVNHFLMITLSIHNPCGVKEEDKAYYAFNLDKWKSQIKKIYFLCYDNVKEIFKKSNPDINQELLKLLVDVSHLVFVNGIENTLEMNDMNSSYSESGCAKKRKISLDDSFQFTIQKNIELVLDGNFENLINNLLSPDAWFWLKFLEFYLCKYSEDLRHLFPTLVQVLCQLLCESKSMSLVNGSLRCLQYLVEALSAVKLLEKDNTILNDAFNSINSELLRCLQLENNTETHEFIRSLIRHSRFIDPIPLLKLYCQGILKASSNNFKTLFIICQNSILPEAIVIDSISKCENIRERLLILLVKGEIAGDSCKEMANLLIALLKTKFDEDAVKMTKEDSSLFTQSTFNDFCKLITDNYMCTAFKNLKFSEAIKPANIKVSAVRLDAQLTMLLINLLKEKWKFLYDTLHKNEENFKERLVVLGHCYRFCELLCHVLCNMQKTNYSALADDVLGKKLELMMHSCTTKTFDYLKINFFDLGSMWKIYNTDFHENIQRLIREPSHMNLGLLQFLYEIFAERNSKSDLNYEMNYEFESTSKFSQLINNRKSIFYFNNLRGREKIIVSTAEILCQYIVIPGSSHSNKYRFSLSAKMIDDLLNNENREISSSCQLQLVLRVIYAFTEFNGISASVLKGCLDLVRLLMNQKFQEPELNIILLQIIKDFCHLVSKVGDDETRETYMKILESFKNAIFVDNRCGVKTALKFVECLVELFRFDPGGEWAVYQTDDSIPKAAAEDILTFLNHSHHEVRMMAAQNVGFFFACNEKTKEKTIVWQRKMLSNLFLTLCENNGLYPREKDCVYEYVVSVLSSVSLISWTSVICWSSFWRKKSFHYLFCLAFSKKFKKADVDDIIGIICAKLSITNQKEYFKFSSEYFLGQWAEKRFHFQDFPYFVLGCDSLDEFIQNHLSEILIAYSQAGEFEVVQDALAKVKAFSLNILTDCYPVILAYVLPRHGKNFSSCEAEKGLKLKKLIDEQLSEESSALCVLKRLDEIIFHMMRNMHDVGYLTSLCTFFGNVEDHETHSNFTGAEIVETVLNLSNDSGKSLLERIAVDSPSVVEKVLLRLLENVERAAEYQDKLFALYKYIFFVEMMSQVTHAGKRYEEINSFIVRDVVYSLIGIMRKDEGHTLTNAACEGLKKLAESYLINFSEIFAELLPVITTALFPLALNSNEKALGVLNFLLCDNYMKLEKYINYLDPFPSADMFVEINRQIARKKSPGKENLEMAIRRFIRAGKDKNSGCRIEGLRHLRKNLSERKDELKKMYDGLAALRGFSEDCKNSLLHQLVCVLVELATNKNSSVTMEAAMCLGELGPSDLTTLVLRPEYDFLAFTLSDSPVNNLFKSSLNRLSDLLTSDNICTKKASSRALYALLSVRQGREILSKYSADFKNFEYLFPFRTDANEDLRLKIKRNVLVETLNDGSLWKLSDDHGKWIFKLVDGLLECLWDSTNIINSFRELIRTNWEFAECLLPLLLDLILCSNDKDCTDIINENFRTFFSTNFNYKSNRSAITSNKRSVHCFLNVVDYIRTRRHHEGIYQESCLDVNYLNFAEAALWCSAYFTSIYYAELWFEQKRRGNHRQIDINDICEVFPEEGVAVTRILRECHSKLGNTDGIHGCGYMHILEFPAEIQHYEHINNWNLSLLHHDILLSMGNEDFGVGLMNSLERCGLYFILKTMMNKHKEFNEISPLQYKCAAQLSDWSLLDLNFKGKENIATKSFDKSFYLALKAFHKSDDATLFNEIQSATKIVVDKLVNCSLESSKNLYRPIAELQILKELKEFVFLLNKNPGKSDLWNLFNKWWKQDKIRCGDFELVESILTSRTVVIKSAIEKVCDLGGISNDLRLMLCQAYLSTIAAARKEKKYETAIRTLNYVNNIKEIPREIFQRLKLEKARILWEMGDKDTGRFVLSHLIRKGEITGDLKAKGLKIYGDWMARTKSENSREIIQNYYFKSISETSEGTVPVDAYASLAKFADSNYEQLNDYLTSPLFEIKQNLINTQQDLATELRQELGLTRNREKTMAYQMAAKQSAIDKNEIKSNKAERDSYLCLALKYYLLSLKSSEKYNLSVFRIVSLWLSNSNHQEIIQNIRKMLHQIPSYKFLCLLPQLMPRMVDVCLISDLIERILQDHPHHTLPLLFALSNSYEDLKYSGNKANVTTPRVQAAKSMLDKFQTDKKLGPLIREMNLFSNALIELANYYPVEKGCPGCPVEFPDHLKIKRLKNLSTLPVPSLTLSYDKNCLYDKIVGVEGFEDDYYLVGGINLPKRIRCIGTDGIGRSLLVKGRDDLRQDAVMQQVFTLINSLLSENAETKKRKLIVRTYKVVPLSQRSGIIEWCENTQPLSLYLTGPDGKSGAHKKFYPEDPAAVECRSLIRKTFAEPGSTNEDKLNVFLDICKRFHPVFHYFFIENFPAAGVWFERRLAYVHSVATSSMIGYILGIGDRHVHNILIDNSTAEVIHIDLGIAFEQGKTLPIPETVPFRLTRDIVDGMGLSGIQGDFRISCIKTMEVLRENQDTILTLLEVLLYDPLYTWTITPEKAYSMQEGQSEASSSNTENKSSPDLEINKMAERALIRLKQKLQGTEAGWVATNVEGQISYLIQQARDPNNLCRLFHGWQAYL